MGHDSASPQGQPVGLNCRGRLWITVGGENLGGRRAHRVCCAQWPTRARSPTAAKAHGHQLQGRLGRASIAMNTLAGEPLVERSTGGRGGGSTRLTARGQRLVERFEQIDAAHQRFLEAAR